MNRRSYLTKEDQAFVEKWKWRIAGCYVAILLTIVLVAGTTANERSITTIGSSTKSLSSAGITHDRAATR
jgi:hypothetical protein